MMKLVSAFVVGILFLIALMCSSSSAQSSELTTPLILPAQPYEAPLTQYSIPLDSIVKIYCGKFVGTAEVINGNTLITASHVVGGQKVCTIGKSVGHVVYDDPARDYAVVYADTGTRGRIAIDCEGFKPNHLYLMVGYPHGKDFSIQIVRATEEFRSSRDQKSGSVFIHTRLLKGKLAIPGMSGGPVFDLDGRMVGTTVAYFKNGTGSLSRELRDTYLCAKTTQSNYAP